MSNYSNIAIFNDTAAFYKSNGILKKSIENSVKNQKLILEKDVISLSDSQLQKYSTEFETKVSHNRTFQAAKPYALKGKKVCVLNFASSRNPGGGVVKGATAQEEALCRISTLYAALTAKENIDGFYTPHQRLDALYNDDIIYTPGVTVFKTDTSNPVMEHFNSWYDVNVITCAAPNLRFGGQISATKLQQIHEKRAKRILDTAVKFDNITVLIAVQKWCVAIPPLLHFAITATRL